MNWKRFCMQAGACAVCIAPPLIATLNSFPLFIERSSSATVSGLSLILFICCSMPLVKLAGKHINSPASPVLWIVVFAISTMMKNIIDEVCMISLIGLCSGGASFFLFKFTDKKFPKDKG